MIILYKDAMNNNQYYSLKAFKQIIFYNIKIWPQNTMLYL